MLWHPKTLQNIAMYNYNYNVFSFLAVFPLPASYQNDPKFHFNTLLRSDCSDTQKSSKNESKTPANSGLGAKPFFAPPAQLKLI